jgi:nucleotide-binding universal stress UspA family protein
MTERATMMNRILVAVDASPRAPVVFDAAAELARKYQAALFVLRAITVPPEFPPAAAASEADPLPGHLTQLATLELMELWKRAPDLISTKPVIGIGQAWKVILSTARELAVDLIVLGSHGYHGWDRVLGTTAAKVANLSDRNVLVVHGEQNRAPAAQEQPSANRQ